jgi:hypothetical protein
VVFKNMSINNSFSGYGFAPEYQLSGLPYVTGIAIVDTRFKIEFPYVAQWFYLRFTQVARTASISFSLEEGFRRTKVLQNFYKRSPSSKHPSIPFLFFWPVIPANGAPT